MKYKKSIGGLLFTCVFLLSLPTWGIGLSAFRIYMDQDQRDATFTVYNRDTLPQDCSLKFKYYQFDSLGNMSVLPTDAAMPGNSAENWVRFSPRNFLLSPANAQTIKFSMRRKANAQPKEYRSYVVIDCGVEEKISEKNNQDGPIRVSPKLLHNVPLIVRTGELQANVTFDNIKVENGALSFDLLRTGNRSVFGDLKLVEKGSDKVISELKMLSIYTETSKKAQRLSLDGHQPQDVQIQFIEDQRYGGSLNIKQDVNI